MLPILVAKMSLSRKELQEIMFISKLFPVWSDSNADKFTQSFHYLLCFEETFICVLCFHLNSPTYHIFHNIICLLFTHCNSMFVTHHRTDLTPGNSISWIFIDVTLSLEILSLGPVLTWHILCDGSVYNVLLVSLIESHI